MNEVCKAIVKGFIEGAIQGAVVVAGMCLITAGVGYLIGNK